MKKPASGCHDLSVTDRVKHQLNVMLCYVNTKSVVEFKRVTVYLFLEEKSQHYSPVQFLLWFIKA